MAQPCDGKRSVSSADIDGSEGSQIAVRYRDLSLMFQLTIPGVCPSVWEII